MVLRDLSTRMFSASVPSIFVSFITALGIALFTGAVALTRDWQPMAPQHLGLLSASAGFLFFGYVFSIKAMRAGEVAFVSPFRYTILVWALLLGIVVFREFPDDWTLAGAAIVVMMGIYTFYRERRLMLRAAVATPAASAAKPTAE
jgi:drug/metabolite transporter (DMT)-like permease